MVENIRCDEFKAGTLDGVVCLEELGGWCYCRSLAWVYDDKDIW